MAEQDRDRIVAHEIQSGRCPFGMLKPGQTIAHCMLGFPGCGCGDEMMLNPFLQKEEGEPEMKTPGQIGYEAYANHTGWKSLATGQDLPQWDGLSAAIKQAWEVAAAAVAVHIESVFAKGRGD